MLFHGDFSPNEDTQALLMHFKNDLARLPVLMTDPEKCVHFYNYVYMNSHAEEWYEEFGNSAPEGLTLWTTLCKHFCIKWLSAPLSTLLGMQ